MSSDRLTKRIHNTDPHKTHPGVPPAPPVRTSGNDQVTDRQPRADPGKGCLSQHKQKN